jgi:hypothetical protein
MSAPTLVVAGALAQKPWVAGHTWVFLQYLLGFRRLGFDVLFIDRLDRGMAVDEAGRPCAAEASVNLAYLAAVARAFGFERSFAVVCDDGRTIGLPRERLRERLRHSAGLLNVMGYLADEDLLEAAPVRVFLDIDPGVGQMWRTLGLADIFRGHDAYVTIGENIGQADCGIPPCGVPWVTSRQPVVLDEWPVAPAPVEDAFTSIATWRGTYGPIDFNGRTYGQRVHEFRRFAEMPRRSGRAFGLALDIDPGEARDLAMLRQNGWTLLDPRVVADTPGAYRDFITRSKAEFTVAKSIVVETKSGWFSDRSICYLSSGRPVLAQDTGLSNLYPVGRGLLTFSDVEEAEAGIDSICADYDAHARAAREIAEACFDSDKVLPRLLALTGMS